MLQTETGLNVLRCSPVLAQLLMSLSCYSMSSFSLQHLLANEQWKTVSVASHSAVVKLCIALCLDYNDIISFYKEHYNMPAAMYSKALSLSPSLPPAGLILLTHSSHASPSLRLNFHLLITWRSLTSSFYSLLSHLPHLLCRSLCFLVSIWCQRRAPVCLESLHLYIARAEVFRTVLRAVGASLFSGESNSPLAGLLCWAAAHSQIDIPHF